MQRRLMWIFWRLSSAALALVRLTGSAQLETNFDNVATSSVAFV